MALHAERNEKAVQGVGMHHDASGLDPTAELHHEMGAFEAYKVGLPTF